MFTFLYTLLNDTGYFDMDGRKVYNGDAVNIIDGRGQSRSKGLIMSTIDGEFFLFSSGYSVYNIKTKTKMPIEHYNCFSSGPYFRVVKSSFKKKLNLKTKKASISKK